MAVTPWKFPGTAAGTGWTATDAGTLVNALGTNDDVLAQHAVGDEYLKMSNFGFSLPSRAIIEGIEVEAEAYVYGGAIISGSYYLGLQASKDNVTPIGGSEHQGGAESPGEMLQVYVPAVPSPPILFGGASDLWAGSWESPEITANTFSIWAKFGSDTDGVPPLGLAIDFLRARIYYSLPTMMGPGGSGEEDEYMDHTKAALEGGWRVLGEEAMPSIASSAQIFANAPVGTQFAEVRIDTADLVMRFNTVSLSGGVWTPTTNAATAANGIKYFANERVRIPGNVAALKRIRAIESGGTTTGWITYWGLDARY